MTTILKLWLATHGLPIAIKTNDALVFYRTVAKTHGMRLEHRLSRYVMV